MINLKKRCLNYFSPSKNKILLVGDRPGPRAETVVPFCSNNFSGGWLNEQLSDFDEDSLQWINAFDQDGNETDLKLLYDRLPAKVVIALGNSAGKWLKKHNIDFVQTYHPQYWKRFKSKEKYPLINIMHSYIRQ